LLAAVNARGQSVWFALSLRVARHGLALIEDEVIGAATLAANCFLVSAFVVHGSRAFLTVRVV